MFSVFFSSAEPLNAFVLFKKRSDAEYGEVVGPRAWRNVNICAFDKLLEVLHKARGMCLGDYSLQSLLTQLN